MARWIHEFRSTGERALTEGERLALRRRAAGLALGWWLYGILGIAAFLAALAAFVFAVAQAFWYGFPTLGLLVLGGYGLTWANNAGRLALLHRRALRLGTVESFRRIRGDETARRLWSRVGSAYEDEGETVSLPATAYWSVDEKFEESLERTARGRVETFDAVGRDGALLWVEGRPVREIIEPPVWEAL